MHLSLGQGHRDAQDAAMTALRDADRHQHGTIHQLSAFAQGFGLSYGSGEVPQ
jgi:hypothetical protein